MAAALTPSHWGAFAPWPQFGGTLSGCQCCFLYSVISFAAHWSQGRENEAKEVRAVTSTWKSFTLLSVVPGAAPSKEMKYSVFWPNKSCSLWVFLVKGKPASPPAMGVTAKFFPVALFQIDPLPVVGPRPLWVLPGTLGPSCLYFGMQLPTLSCIYQRISICFLSPRN